MQEAEAVGFIILARRELLPKAESSFGTDEVSNANGDNIDF